jgi:hypothetical protein
MKLLFKFAAAAAVAGVFFPLVGASSDFALYSDQSCTTPLSSINWGSLTPGQNVTRDVYLKNLASLEITEFHVAAANYTPLEAENYLSLSLAAGEPGNVPLQPQQTIDLALTLSVNPSVQGITEFSFNIVLTVVYGSGPGSSGGGGFGGGSQSQTVPSGAGSNGNGGGSFDSAGLLGVVALCVVVYVLVGGKRK